MTGAPAPAAQNPRESRLPSGRATSIPAWPIPSEELSGKRSRPDV